MKQIEKQIKRLPDKNEVNFFNYKLAWRGWMLSMKTIKFIRGSILIICLYFDKVFMLTLLGIRVFANKKYK